jgi:predicted lipoprotein with Yx(FWY)xxD motif
MSAPRILTLVTAAVLLVAACSSAGGAAGPYGGGASSPAAVGGGASSAAGVVIGSAHSATFGTVLTGPNGMTLYTHAGDSATESTCTGSCATAWPPLTTTGQPTAASSVTGQLGTATRADGTTLVSYNGLPVYFWQGDTKAGDVTGDGVEGFSVATVKASGAAPKTSPEASAPSSPDRYNY